MTNASHPRSILAFGALILAASGQSASGQQVVSGAPVIMVGTSFVEAQGPTHCNLTDPMPTGAKFPKGTMALAWFVGFDPATSSLENVQFKGMDFATLRTRGSVCQDYVIINGQPRVHRVSGTIERSDGQPFLSGKYEAHFTVSGAGSPLKVVTFTVQ